MEARYVEAGSMSIFWTPNRALKTTSLGGTRWVPALLYVGPKSGSVGRGGTRRVPALLYVGPYPPFGFYNANYRVRGGPMIAIFIAL